MIAAGRMRSVRFSYNLKQARVSLNDDSYERQPGMTARAYAPVVRKIAVGFGDDIRDRQLERSTYSVSVQGLTVV